MTDLPEVRLDKWLWAARFFKTRSIARNAIDGGKVHYEGVRAKPGRKVELGASLRIRQGYDEKDVVVTGLAERRGPASEAAALYRETDESMRKREELARARALNPMAGEHRPDKKQRRQLHRFKRQE